MKVTNWFDGVSITAVELVGLDGIDHENELTPPAVSAERYTFIPLGTTRKPVET